MDVVTDQEALWAGEFGDAYTRRSTGSALLAANVALFAQALHRADKPSSCIEFGANVGMCLRALKALFPDQEQAALEINPAAVAILRRSLPDANVIQGSILAFRATRTWDLVLLKGVLIHQNPETLPAVYDSIVAACGRWLLICEYFNPTPVMVEYRGAKDRLFKRDFAGEIMGRHSCMTLADYGFVYRRDPSFPQDDVNWFLMEKRTRG